MRRSGLGALLVAVLLLAGCASGDPLRAGNGADGPLVVGSADFAESELMMEIYAEALRDTGAEVTTKSRIGAREFYVNAARQGELSVVPDYTGNLLKYFDESAEATESRAVYEQVRSKLPPGLEVLEQSRAENSDVLVVTERTARSGIRSLADLGPRCGEFVLGAPAEWKPRWAGKIAALYGCRFQQIRSVEAGSITVDALVDDQVQVANLFTTSSEIKEEHLVELDDPLRLYPAQNIVPLVADNRLTPEQTEALNRVSRAMTTGELAELNRRLEVDKANPRDLAKEFLTRVR